VTIVEALTAVGGGVTTMLVAVTVGGTYNNASSSYCWWWRYNNASSSYCWWRCYNNVCEGTSPHIPLLAANKFVQTPFVDTVPRAVNMYGCVRKVLCRSVLARAVLGVMDFVEKQFLLK
jgi:hypothetical protein